MLLNLEEIYENKSSGIVDEIEKKQESNLREFKNPNSDRFKELNIEKEKLTILENDLKAKKKIISDLEAFEDLKIQTECEILKGRLPKTLLAGY